MWRLLVAVVLFLGLLVGRGGVVEAQSTCPAVAPLVNSWQNLTYPSGVSAIFDRIGGSKQINYGWGPSNLSGEPSGYGYANFHHGIDTNHVYERVYAPYAGTASAISPAGWSGALIIKLVLPNGRYYYFAHLSDQIASGAVKVGDILGVTGNTGYSTGPHMHTQFMESNGTAIPPEHWSCKSGGAGVTTSDPVPSSDQTDTSVTGALAAPWVMGTDTLTSGVATSGVTELKYASPATTCLWCTALRETGKADGSVSVTTVINNSRSGPVFRAQDQKNFLYFGGTAGGKLGISQVVNGSSSSTNTLAENTAIPAGRPSGTVLRVSYNGSTIKGYENGVEVVSVTSGQFQAATKVGYGFLGAASQKYQSWSYTQNSDGTATAPVPGEDTTDKSDSGSFWNPMSWLWDKLKGVLIPTETDWEEVATALSALGEKEPIGTIRDVSSFAGTVKTQVVAPVGNAAPAVIGTQGSGWLAWLSFGVLWTAGVDAGSWLAMLAEGVTLGPVNALQLVQLSTDFLIMWLLFDYIRGRIVITA